MRVPVRDLSPEKTIPITGSEDWLARIYADFPLTEDKGAKARVEGVVRLVLEEAGSVHATGRITYAPVLACARCDRPIAFGLALAIDARFLPDPLNAVEKEINLTEKDLDLYYVDGGEVDVEGLINDMIQTALPSRLVVANDDESCQVCGIDLSDDLLYQTKNAEDASPFSALKGLKLH